MHASRRGQPSRGALDQLTCTGVSLYRRPGQHQENPQVLSRAQFEGI